MPIASKTFRLTGVADFLDAGAGLGAVIRVVGARLVAGATACSAQITDGDGTVLYDLAAIATGSDESDQCVRAVRKVTLASIAGTGAAVTVYVE